MRGLTDRDVRHLMRIEDQMLSGRDISDLDQMQQSDFTVKFIENHFIPDSYVNRNITSISSARNYNLNIEFRLYQDLLEGKPYAKSRVQSLEDALLVAVRCGAITNVWALKQDVDQCYADSPFMELRGKSVAEIEPLLADAMEMVQSGLFGSFNPAPIHGESDDLNAIDRALTPSSEEVVLACAGIVEAQEEIMRRAAEKGLLTPGQTSAFLTSVIERMIVKDEVTIPYSVRDFQMFTRTCRQTAEDNRNKVFAIIGKLCSVKKPTIQSYHATMFTVMPEKIDRLIEARQRFPAGGGVLFLGGDLHFRSPVWYSREKSEGFNLDHRIAVYFLTATGGKKSQTVKWLQSLGFSRSKSYRLIADIQDISDQEQVSILDLFQKRDLPRDRVIMSNSIGTKALCAVGEARAIRSESRIVNERLAFRYDGSDKDVDDEVLALVSDDILEARSRELFRVANYYTSRKNKLREKDATRAETNNRKRLRDFKEAEFYAGMTSMIDLSVLRKSIGEQYRNPFSGPLPSELNRALFAKAQRRKSVENTHRMISVSALPVWEDFNDRWSSPFDYIQEFRSSVDFDFDIKSYPNFNEVSIIVPLFTKMFKAEPEVFLDSIFWRTVRGSLWRVNPDGSVNFDAEPGLGSEDRSEIKKSGLSYLDFLNEISIQLLGSVELCQIARNNACRNFNVFTRSNEGNHWMQRVPGHRISGVPMVNQEVIDIMSRDLVEWIVEDKRISYGFNDIGHNNLTMSTFNDKTSRGLTWH